MKTQLLSFIQKRISDRLTFRASEIAASTMKRDENTRALGALSANGRQTAGCALSYKAWCSTAIIATLFLTVATVHAGLVNQDTGEHTHPTDDGFFEDQG